MTAGQAAERGDDGVVLIGRHGAGGDPDLLRPGSLDELAAPANRASGRARLEIVLEIAGVAHLSGGRAEFHEPFAHLFRLRQNDIHGGQHGAEEPRELAVARQRRGRKCGR